MSGHRLAAALAAAAILAAPGAPCRAGTPDADAVLARMEKAGAGIRALTAEFRQERIYALFDERRESSGTITYKKPGMMLWQYRSPDRTAIYIKGRRALMYLPDIRQVQAVSLAKDRKTEMLLIGFGNTAEEITRNFRVEASRGEDGTHVLDLVPAEEGLAAHFRRLRLFIDPERWLPVRSERFEAGGDRTIFTFSNVRTDVAPDDALFDFTPPEGVEVVEY
ncbi:MAG: outer membrane lipoprotein carrier protein LolA [bacterium]|nr:outer membrane lipoprotein carrier protein LolA [bacterium]